jgi:fructose-1,6-bisphosphatase I
MINLDPLYTSFKDISEYLKFNDVTILGKNTESLNSSHDIQKPIDIYANNIIIQKIKEIPEVIGYISEETHDVILTSSKKRGYLIIFDPLDGSKNVYSNLTVGTIYGVYDYDVENDKLLSILETGYCLYGPSTILVKTQHNKIVQQYELSKNNDFVFKREIVKSNQNTVYAINMSYDYDNDINTFIRSIKLDGATQRWLGAMVADCHQILSKGGTFIYPKTNKNPNGKIRLLYEAIPFAHIFTILGGTAIDINNVDILDRLPHIKIRSGKIHGETPIILSTYYSKNNIINMLDLNDLMNC